MRVFPADWYQSCLVVQWETQSRNTRHGTQTGCISSNPLIPVPRDSREMSEVKTDREEAMETF